MRVTIGERLGLSIGTKPTVRLEARTDEAVPVWVEPEVVGPVVRLAECPSSSLPLGTPTVREDDGGPRRVRGEMVWLHKTAPTLVIEGQTISPEEHAAGRRR